MNERNGRPGRRYDEGPRWRGPDEVERERWRSNSRETFEALVAMRNSLNEHIPMSSLESDLLTGPESSVFCARVAEAVVGAMAAKYKAIGDLHGRLFVEGEAATFYRAASVTNRKRAETVEGILRSIDARPEIMNSIDTETASAIHATLHPEKEGE